MLRDLTSYEIAEWMAYYALEPWGSRQLSEQIGFVIAKVLNMFSKKGAKPLKHTDFMIPSRLDDEEPQESKADDQKAIGIFKAIKESRKKNG